MPVFREELPLSKLLKLVTLSVAPDLERFFKQIF